MLALIAATRMAKRFGWVLLALGCMGCGSADDDSGNPSTAGMGGGAGVPSGSSSAGGGAAVTTGGAPTGMPTGGAPTAIAGTGGGSGSGARDAGGDTGESDIDAATSDASIDPGSCARPGGTAAKPGFLGDWSPGTYPSDFRNAAGGNYLTIAGLPNQNGTDRQYAVHVPPGYDKDVPIPALFCLHAFSMNALSFCDDMAGWLAKADQEDFIVIMPNGYMNSFNVGSGCGAALIAAYVDGIDDVAFIRILFDEVGKHVNIDLGRVYATGFSNGAALSWRLACEVSDIFTAVAPVAGGSCLEACEPSHEVSMLDIHGTADFISPPDNHAMSIAAITASNGCSTTTMPSAVPTTAGVSMCLTRTGCPTGCANVEVTQCTVTDGSHCWYGDISSADCGPGAADSELFTTNLAWEFLRRLAR